MKNKKVLRKIVAALSFGLIFSTVAPATSTVVKAEQSQQVETITVESGISDIQKYGNIELSIRPEVLEEKGFEFEDTVTITVNGKVYDNVPYVTNYSDVANGEYLIGNIKGKTIVAINMGNFAKDAGIATKEKLKDGSYLWKNQKGEVLSKNAMNAIKVNVTLKAKDAYHILSYADYTNNRDDYTYDSTFANFRNVQVGNLGEGVFFRSASPINPEIGRSKYADMLARIYGVETVMNLADSNSDIETFAKEGLSPYYTSLYNRGQVIALNLGVDYQADNFREEIARGMRFFSIHRGPYLVHCKEGKDRAGFTSALIEALMGATYDEITEDYLKTYCNYYHIEKGSEDYDVIRERNIDKMLMYLTNTTTLEELKKADLQKAAETYLLEGGLSEWDLNQVKENLSKDLKTKVECTFKAVDKYGDVITTMTEEDVNDLGIEIGDMLNVAFAGKNLEIPYVVAFDDALDGKNLARPSKGNVMLALKGGKFVTENNITGYKKDSTGAVVWEPINGKELNDFDVVISIAEKGGYLEDYKNMQVERTNNREDYASDAEFANFRNVKIGKLGNNAFFRTSSPINAGIGRASYADTLAKKNGVNAIMNLADSSKKIDGYIAKDNFASPYYKSLYDEGNVIPLNLSLGFNKPEFQSELAKGFKFFASHEGPYLVHCREGKDRAGFTSALIECLMGASYEEMADDYLLTYINYYHVEKGDPKYEVRRANIDSMLSVITGQKDVSKLSRKDFEEAAVSFLERNGVTAKEIETLQTNLANNYTAPAVVVETTHTTNGNVYVVKAGDSLWNISKSIYGTSDNWKDIFDVNKNVIKDSNKIYVGQEIVLP